MTIRKGNRGIMRSCLLMSCAGILLSLAIGALSAAHATNSPPPFRLIPRSGSTVVKGGSVYLFHSGTRDITGTVRRGDIFIVYRINPSCKMEEVGKIRFVDFVGETYMEAEVIDGKLKSGDIARKGNISCLIVPAEPCTR